MSDPAAPKKKFSVVTCLIIGLCLLLGGAFVLGLLSALLLPAIARAVQSAKVASCANNLRQLWTLQQVYVSQFGGRDKEFPTETGSAFWLKLSQTTPALVDPSEIDLYYCPAGKNPGGLPCDYLGPGRPVKALQSSDPVGADRSGNHKEGGNVLRKDGSVVEALQVEFSSISDKLSP